MTLPCHTSTTTYISSVHGRALKAPSSSPVSAKWVGVCVGVGMWVDVGVWVCGCVGVCGCGCVGVWVCVGAEFEHTSDSIAARAKLLLVCILKIFDLCIGKHCQSKPGDEQPRHDTHEVCGCGGAELGR